MKKIKNIIYILPVFLFLACTERIDIELNEGDNNRLVVEGGITNQPKVHQIKLSRTGSYFLNEKTPMELGAEVSVTDGDNIFTFLDNNNDGIYETLPGVAGEAGKTYTLNIKLQSGEEYTSEYYMRPINPMDSIKYVYEDNVFTGNPHEKDAFYKILLYAQEKEGEGDAYMWNLYINGELDTDTLREKTFVWDQEVDGNYIHDWEVYYIESDKIVDDETMIGIEMASISHEHYNYNIAFMLETDWRGGMFDGPPANIPSNISDGALGFFYASAVHYLEIPIYYKRNKK